MKTDRIDNLFIVLTGIYRHKWTSGLENEAVEVATIQAWKHGINDLTDEEVNCALEKCLLAFDWPPSISEFRKLAKNIPSFTDALQQMICYKLILSERFRLGSADEDKKPKLPVLDKFMKQIYTVVRDLGEDWEQKFKNIYKNTMDNYLLE